MKSFAEVDRLTIPEYNLLMDAVRLQQVDQDYRNHLQAFLNFKAKAQKRVGKHKMKPVYTRFEKFYNYEAAVNRARRKKKKSRFSGLTDYLRGGGGHG